MLDKYNEKDEINFSNIFYLIPYIQGYPFNIESNWNLLNHFLIWVFETEYMETECWIFIRNTWLVFRIHKIYSWKSKLT